MIIPKSKGFPAKEAARPPRPPAKNTRKVGKGEAGRPPKRYAVRRKVVPHLKGIHFPIPGATEPKFKGPWTTHPARIPFEIEKNVGGVIYKKKKGTLKFYKNGRVKRGILALDTAFKIRKEIVVFMAGTEIKFDPKGKVLSGILLKSAILQGTEFRGGEKIEFYPNGKVFQGTLAFNTAFKVGGKRRLFLSGSEIAFGQNGQPISGTLAEPARFHGIYFMAGTEMMFYKKGELMAANLVVDRNIRGVKYRKGFFVQFHKNGNVKRGFLAEKMSLLVGRKAIPLPPGTQVVFYPNGKVSHVFTPKGSKMKFLKSQAASIVR